MNKKLNRITSWRIVSFVVFLLLNSYAYNQNSPCDCADLNSSNLCNGGYFSDYNTANSSTPNPYTPPTPLTWTTNGSSYTFCTKYTAPAGVSKIGLLNYIGSNHQVQTNGCTFTRSNWTAYASGCSSPVTGGNAQGTNAYEFPVTPGVEYRFCVTVTLNDAQCQNIEAIENYLYTAATSSPPSGCTATIGTFSMQKNGSATSNASSYDLLPDETFTITSNNNATLPPVGVDGDQSGVGYAAFSCDPSGYDLGDPAKYNTTDMPCYLGLHYSPSMTDANNTNSQVNGLSLTSWWFVPLTFDDVCSSSKSTSPCPSGNSTSIGIDTDGDGCMAYSSPIQINYVTQSCGDCTNPACPIYLTSNGASSPSGTYPSSNHITENAVGPATVTECHLVTVTSTNQRLGFRQSIFQANNGCATRTYELKATDANGHCIGAAINKSQDGSYSSLFNPEWDNLPPGDYVMCITQTLGVGCDIDYINTGYYLENLPIPPCPTDQSFIELDWTQSNPFVTFPSTTYTCTDGPQTIWKNIDAATIDQGGELQAYPGFFMELTTNNNSATRTSALISVNGVPYSYYGPSAPSNVLDWGPMAVPPQFQNILEPYITAGATVTIDICDTRNTAQSFPYTIWDYSTGSILASGTATPSNGNCTTITFTIASPTMTWNIDGNTALITNNNNGSATFDPTALSSGVHTITYTYNNNNGCPITATKNITVGPTTLAPTVANVNYCQNALAVPLTATGSNLLWYTASTGGTGSTTAPTPLTTSAGTTSYWVTQTSGGCESPRAKIDVIVTATETPVVTCGTSTSTSVQFNWTALTGATNYAITYTVNGGGSQSGGSTASPTFSLTSLNPGDNVVITIVTTGIGCYANGTGNCIAQACTTPVISTQPSVQSACEGQSATFSVSATGASGYQWEISTNGGTSFVTLNDGGVYTGATTSTLSISDNTGLNTNQYRVVVLESNGLCPLTSNAVLLTAITIETPVVTCGTSTSTSVQFNWTALTGATNYAITYTVNGGGSQSGGSTASPTFSLSSLNPGDNVVITIVTTGTGCYANGTGTCTAQSCNSPSITTQPAVQSACEGLTATFTVNATGATGYQWEVSTNGGVNFNNVTTGGVYSGATSATLNISDNTGLDANQYRVTIAETNGLCPVTSNNVLLTVYPTPTITGNSIVCSNTTTSLTSSTTANTWATSNTSVVSIDNNGLVSGVSQGVSTITLVDINTCQQTKTITVPVDQTPIITCGVASEDSVEFNWTIPNGATSYDLAYSIMGGNQQIIQGQIINRLGVTGLNIGDTVSLNITTNGNGCYVDNTTFCHTTCTPPDASFLPSPSKMNTLNTTTTMINSSSNATSYFWDFGDGETSNLPNPSKTYPDTDTATYLVTLTASNGSCTDVATYYIKIFEDLVYYIPNTFTPDNNDWNQQFKPIFKSGYDTGNYQLQIFNRWGDLIFVSTDINIGWNGTDQGSGKTCEDGTYIWKIEFGIKGIDKRELIDGHVNLLK